MQNYMRLWVRRDVVADPADLTGLQSHFAFGENWAAYADKISQEQINEAINGLERLYGGRLDGRRFLDIGCGSGLHSLAALRLGAIEVVCVDIDPDSVATTKKVLSRYSPGSAFRVEQVSVFDMDPVTWGQFDTVYSWGVLHHTGDMYRALRSAAALVKPGGAFIVALYRKTWLCWFWRIEKRWYARASSRAQAVATSVYVWICALLKGKSVKTYVDEYRADRGMNVHNDLHDWLGGYPYESITPESMQRFMTSIGFASQRVFAYTGRFFGRFSGIVGSGCDEYAFVRFR
jgi:2-polyprenyl-6-hydroxyphenyl methylase/3-demethylubiquinone-9 3-methyltransferase